MTDEVKQSRDIKSVSPIDETSDAVEGDINVVPFSLPIVSGEQMVKGLGAKYLNMIEKTNTFVTTSTSFQDVTDLVITKPISERTVLLIFFGQIEIDIAPSYAHMTFDIDGTNQGGSDGLVGVREPVINCPIPTSMFYITSELRGSHTFKVKMKSTSGDSATLGSSTTRLIFAAVELT